MNRRDFAIALAASLLGVAATWIVLGLGRGERPGSAVESVPARSAAAGAPAPDPQTPAGPPAKEAPLADPPRVEVAAVEGGSSDVAPGLHVPDFGPALLRPSARAKFELRDARGQPLEPVEDLRAELHRTRDGACVRHFAEVEGSRVLCGGPAGAGLPPGRYALDVRAGPYGAARVEFELGLEETLERIVELPRWRRILRLELLDAQGRPLPKVTQRPEYERVLPDDVVLPSDPIEALHSSSVALAGAFPSSRRGWEAYYLTDAGAFYVRVFAGTKGRVKLDLEPHRYGRGPIELESDFTGPEWDRREIVLEPVPGLEERMADWVCVNPGDPGDRSLIAAPAAVGGQSIGDPWSLDDMLGGRFRMIVKVDAPVAVRMLTEAGPPRRASPEVLERTSWEADDVWFVDVPRFGNETALRVRYSFTDDFLYLAEARPLELAGEELAAATKIETGVSLPGTPLELVVVPPTPTLAAYACGVRATVASAPTMGERSATLAGGPDGAFRAGTALAPADARTLASKAELAVEFLAPEGPGFVVRRDLDARERSGLVAGSLRLDATCGGWGGGLVGRVLDRDLVGIAGARVALIGEEHLDLAVRGSRDDESGPERSSEGIAAGSARPDESADPRSLLTAQLSLGASAATPVPPSEAPPGTALARARRIVRRAGGSPERDVMTSDADGYVLDSRIRLEPGRRYALVVSWIDADEVVRDHAIRFVAAEGITDLGAVHVR